jgi:hypothetical protein
VKLIDFTKILPADLPEGEQILWHGRPDWSSLARRAFWMEWVGAYFLLMAAWNFTATAAESSVGAAALVAGKTVLLGVLALALLAALAYCASRTTLYVITSRRVVMKVGMALPIFFNLPFASIGSAGVYSYRDGTCEIPLALTGPSHIAYLHLWPHARPYCWQRPEPMMRAVPSAVADLLARALIAAANERMAGEQQQQAVTKSGREPSGRRPYADEAAIA